MLECTKEQKVKIADYYQLDGLIGRMEVNLKVHLFKIKVSTEAAGVSAVFGNLCLPVQEPGVSLTFQQRKKLMLLETERLVFLEEIKHDTELAKLDVQRQILRLVGGEKTAADASQF